MFTLAFNLIVLCSAIASIVGDRPNNRLFHYIFKPVTMLLLIGYLVTQGLPDTTFSYAMFVGLAFSLLGDVFLMLPKERFMEGLGSFLVAHIAYLAAFYQLFEPQVTYWWLALLVLIAIIFYKLLAGHLGPLKIPVIVYISVIMSMVWMAGELYWQSPTYISLTLFIGAVVFAFSDSSLAWNKFKQPFKGAQWAILTTYFFAQWMFAQAALI